jgi:hypothetical protein
MSVRIETHAEPIPGYKLLERIGQGGFGEVWKAEAPGGFLKAIKIVHGDLRADDADISRHAEQELRALKRVQSVRHPYLLSLERYDVVDGKLLIVMELADCNLWDQFRECRSRGYAGIPRDTLVRYMQEAAEVLDLMNTRYQLQHLDIKPQNLFLIYDHVKVADFGMVKDLEGVRAAITGGVTPVYAAPETFDGMVTRFCDQYSLAIVYQELLSGQRPFSGTTVQHLVMQHLQAVPDLRALPPGDRPAVLRALSKKPEDRFASCAAFVAALMAVGDSQVGSSHQIVLPPPSTPPNDTSTPDGPVREVLPLPAAAPDTPMTQLRSRREEVTTPAAEPLALREAPPESTGQGSLVPAVVIGLGQTGVGVLRRLRQQLTERFGPADRLPNLRLIAIDTDSDTLEAATVHPDEAPLAADEVILARLNRVMHYLKPRRNGRSLIEGWLDPQTLHAIPRNLATQGLRALGRLAFCDHYRAIAQKIRTELEACAAHDVLAAADRHTKLGLRTNRPRVYVVAGLGGGTGGGMFLDAAYTARLKLKQLGYDRPEVYGVLMLPPVDRAPNRLPALSNAYAALTELHHFGVPGNAFTASYDDKDGNVRDPEPPFTRCVLLPAQPVPSAKRKSSPGFSLYGDRPAAEAPEEPPLEPTSRAADWLRRELTSPFGRAADQKRQAVTDERASMYQAFGTSSFHWPRSTVLARAARRLCRRVIDHWTATAPGQEAERVRAWAAGEWARQQIGPEAILTRLQQACTEALGQSPDAVFQAEADPYAPRGWRSKDADTAKVSDTMFRLQQLVGVPIESVMHRQTGKLEQTLARTGDALAKEWSEKVARFAPCLIEQPESRIAGAEQALLFLREQVEQVLAHYEQMATDLSKKAVEAYSVVENFLINPVRGRRASAQLADVFRLYPTWRYQCLQLRQVCQIFVGLRGQVVDHLREVGAFRQRLATVGEELANEPPASPLESWARLLPAGCTTADQAVERFLSAVTPADLRTLDHRLQVQIEKQFSTFINVCTSTYNLLGDLRQVMLEQARNFLSAKLTEPSVTEMFLAKHGGTGEAARAAVRAFEEAEPGLGRMGGANRTEMVLLGVPGDVGCEQLVREAARALPDTELVPVKGLDEIIFYRESPVAALSNLPHLGGLAFEAYQHAREASGCTPHARLDVEQWADLQQ